MICPARLCHFGEVYNIIDRILHARNLLGLVYYGRGDVVEALVEWILSKNFQSHDNIANYYISKVQEVPGELEEINQAVKKFNLSLIYAGAKWRRYGNYSA